jgi:hypothetical protein
MKKLHLCAFSAGIVAALGLCYISAMPCPGCIGWGRIALFTYGIITVAIMCYGIRLTLKQEHYVRYTDQL